MYNADLDIWFDMPDLNVGRHYHSSCTFDDKMVYVFCGIANHTRKYVNSIERYDHSNRLKWHMIELNLRVFPERQGAGVVQKDDTNILIFGGFAGRFKKDCFLLNTKTNQITETNPCVAEAFFF